MNQCAHKYGVDVFMDDAGFYRAECADCDWKSGRCFSEGEAQEAARKHDPSYVSETDEHAEST